MKLAILETGYPPGDLAERFGDYAAMFAEMLGPDFEFETFDVQSGHLPVPGNHDAVYEPLDWLPGLFDFIRAAGDSKMVGVCFGHQAMAEALGGHVEKSSKGWGAGLQHYDVDRVEPWMDAGTVAIPASHHDQVVVQPPNTEIVASSDFTPYAALAWTDRPAISFQFHPEFSAAFAKALIAERYDRVPNPDAAIASLDAPNDNARVAGWIRRFLKA
jgi:GMP synthase-like glutamine amidotransferase